MILYVYYISYSLHFKYNVGCIRYNRLYISTVYSLLYMIGCAFYIIESYTIYTVHTMYIIILQHIQSSIHVFLPLKINLCATRWSYLVWLPQVHLPKTKTHKDNYLQIFQHDEVHRPFRPFFAKTVKRERGTRKKMGCRQSSAKVMGLRVIVLVKGVFV